MCAYVDLFCSIGVQSYKDIKTKTRWEKREYPNPTIRENVTSKSLCFIPKGTIVPPMITPFLRLEPNVKLQKGKKKLPYMFLTKSNTQFMVGSRLMSVG